MALAACCVMRYQGNFIASCLEVAGYGHMHNFEVVFFTCFKGSKNKKTVKCFSFVQKLSIRSKSETLGIKKSPLKKTILKAFHVRASKDTDARCLETLEAWRPGAYE